jgi:hypothetical protein
MGLQGSQSGEHRVWTSEWDLDTCAGSRRMSFPGTDASGSRLPRAPADGSVGTMLLVAAGGGNSGLDLSVKDEVERSIAVKRIPWAEKKDHLAPGIIGGQVFEALSDSRPDAASVELPEGIVPFPIGVTPSQDGLGFAQVVDSLPAQAKEFRDIFRGD